jgi:holo-[acyl-carrier protein] synthase
VTAPLSLRVGIDLVQVSRITESLDRFGARFLRRVFTDAEAAYATAEPSQTALRLAARFAAKEATIKALGLVDHPMNWRDIEVIRAPSGACEMSLRGSAGEWAETVGAHDLAVSLSHEGDYATAVVIARLQERPHA